MTTAPKRRKFNPTAIIVMAAIMVPGAAGAVILPDHAPIPTDRPNAVASRYVTSALHFPEPVQISTREQEIPESRRDVRVVGSNFLPAADENIDFRTIADSQSTAVSHAERFMMMAMARLFERSDDDQLVDDQPVQVAATTN